MFINGTNRPSKKAHASGGLDVHSPPKDDPRHLLKLTAVAKPTGGDSLRGGAQWLPALSSAGGRYGSTLAQCLPEIRKFSEIKKLFDDGAYTQLTTNTAIVDIGFVDTAPAASVLAGLNEKMLKKWRQSKQALMCILNVNDKDAVPANDDQIRLYLVPRSGRGTVRRLCFPHTPKSVTYHEQSH